MEIFLHEFGHAFADLSDEYWAGTQYAEEKANMTQVTNLTRLKWKNWYGDAGVGLYPHEESPTWYRPHQGCKMRYLGTEYPFCAVCTQAFVEKTHSMVSPLLAHYPTSSDIVTENSQKFTLDLLMPVPNTLKVKWTLNNLAIGSNSSEMTINGTNLKTGTNVLNVTVEDTTALLRVDNHHTIHLSTVSWNIVKGSTGIDNPIVSSQKMNIRVFPNPVRDNLFVRVEQNQHENLKIEVVDLLGKTQVSRTFAPQDQYLLSLSHIQSGHYVLKIYLGNALIGTTMIIKN